MASKVSDLLVLTTAPCVDTGDVGCLGPFFLMPFCWCGTTFHMLMRMGEFLVASDHVRACDQVSLVMTCCVGELHPVTTSRQHVLNVVHQWRSRVLVVGIADFRCFSHLQCFPVPRGLPRRTVFH